MAKIIMRHEMFDVNKVHSERVFNLTIHYSQIKGKCCDVYFTFSLFITC
jgi:hypothetical protein